MPKLSPDELLNSSTHSWWKTFPKLNFDDNEGYRIVYKINIVPESAYVILTLEFYFSHNRMDLNSGKKKSHLLWYRKKKERGF